MPSITLTDSGGLNVSAGDADSKSTATKYLLNDLKYVFDLATFKADQALTLAQVPEGSLPFTLKANATANIGIGPIVCLCITGAGRAQLSEITGDDAKLLRNQFNLPAPSSGSGYLSFETSAEVSSGITATINEFSFGFAAGGQCKLSHSAFHPQLDSVKLLDATKDLLAHFTIPARIEDLESLPLGSVCQVEGHGNLTFTTGVGYQFVNNALLTANFTALKNPALTATGNAQLTFAVKIDCGYKVMLAKVSDSVVRLSLKRSHDLDFDTSLTVSAGLTGTAEGVDLLSLLVRQLSPNAAQEMKKLSGLSESDKDSIKEAIQSAFETTCSLAITAEIEEEIGADILFLYEIDLAAVRANGNQAAIASALRGNLTEISSAANNPASGIKALQSLATRTSTTRHKFTVHLLNLFEYDDVSTLILQRTVKVIPDTGALVITDQASANQVQLDLAGPHADPQKIRKLLFTSAILTAAYKGSQAQVAAPELDFELEHFRFEANTDASLWHQHLNALVTASAISQQQANALASLEHPGPTSIRLDLHLNASDSQRLFLDQNSHARPLAFFENTGRAALLDLLKGDPACPAARLRPLQDLQLWNRLKSEGGTLQAAANILDLDERDAPVIFDDYLRIRWWSGAMTGYAQLLEKMRALVTPQGSIDTASAQFKTLESALAAQAKKVAAESRDWFDMPWGVLAASLVLGPSTKLDAAFVSKPLVIAAPAEVGATAATP